MSARADLMELLGRRFARLATDAVMRRPALWRVFRAPIRRQFDRLGPRWDTMCGPDHLAAYEAALANVQPSPGRALDLGTGTGAGAFAIARRFGEAEVTAVDIAPGMIEAARRNTPPELAGRVHFIEADAAALPFSNASFDLVAHANMIPFFDELARVLAPGGFALFGFSGGAETPIYVPPARIREELAARGFVHFEDFSAGRGLAFLAHKEKSE